MTTTFGFKVRTESINELRETLTDVRHGRDDLRRGAGRSASRDQCRERRFA